MQNRLSPGDIKLLWAAGVVSFLLVAAAGFVQPIENGEESTIPSSYGTGRNGALGPYLLLSERGFPVERWLQGPDALPEPENVVLVIAGPTQYANRQERLALHRFVSDGGRVLFTGAGLEGFFPELVTESEAFRYPSGYRATAPSSYTRGALDIEMEAAARWTGKSLPDTAGEASSTLALYGPAEEPAVAVTAMGSGEVVWWAGPTPLTNGGVLLRENLRLFLNALSNPDGSHRRVLWDEYFHGDEGDLWSYVAKTPVRWALWQLALAAIVVLFAFSRRSGPIVPMAVRSRLSPLEFVDTMAELYQRAGAASVAVEVPYRRLRRQLAQRLGRESSTEDTALARYAGLRLGTSEGELRETLEQARILAGMSKGNPGEALKVVQKLAHFTRQLTAVQPLSNPSQEKDSTWNS